MIIFILIISFIFGLIIGSFLNVVIYRHNTNLKIYKGRSKCFSCGRYLDAKDLIPVFSYIFYKGRCRTCKSAVSIQYPLIELLTAIMFTVITYFYFFNINNVVFIGNYIFNSTSILDILINHSYIRFIFYIFDLSILSLMICIFVYDFKHKIIPNKLVYLAAFIAFIKMLILILLFKPTFIHGVFLILSGPIVALPYALLFVVSGGRWMGLGDAKLSLVVGWMLGISYGFNAAWIYASWSALIVILAMFLIREMLDAFSTKNNAFGKKINFIHNKKLQLFRNSLPSFRLRSEIPFGPFIIIGFYMMYFWGESLLLMF